MARVALEPNDMDKATKLWRALGDMTYSEAHSTSDILAFVGGDVRSINKQLKEINSTVRLAEVVIDRQAGSVTPRWRYVERVQRA
jgi:hypothetical protein